MSSEPSRELEPLGLFIGQYPMIVADTGSDSEFEFCLCN